MIKVLTVHNFLVWLLYLVEVEDDITSHRPHISGRYKCNASSGSGKTFSIFLYNVLYLFYFFAEITFCAHIAPNTKSVIGREGESATLSCLYQSNSSHVLLFWGRILPKQAPEFLLLKGARSDTQFQSVDPRYDSATSNTFTFLIINNLKQEDMAAYYCVLEEHSDKNYV